MKIAHIAVVTPHRAGLYETTRDLVEAERTLGMDARICDPTKESKGTERDVPIVNSDFVGISDIVVNHSGLTPAMRQMEKSMIHVLHGRPYSSFLLEQAGKIPVYSFLKQIGDDPTYRAFVTFWSEFLPYFSAILPNDRLHAVPPPVSLKRWRPDGPSGYGFHGHKGKINVVVTDIWRRDKDPFHVINAFMLFARNVQGARLHIYASPQKGTAWAVLKNLLQEAGVAGEIIGFVRGLDNVYRAADMMITPHRIATRSVREALACGCQVVMAPGNQYTPYQADPEDIQAFARAMLVAYHERDDQRGVANRKAAERYFDSEETARQLLSLMTEVNNGRW